MSTLEVLLISISIGCIVILHLWISLICQAKTFKGSFAAQTCNGVTLSNFLASVADAMSAVFLVSESCPPACFAQDLCCGSNMAVCLQQYDAHFMALAAT